MSKILEAAHQYTNADHWHVVPVPYREKAPVLKGWQNLRLTEADLAQHFNGQRQNIGVLNGEPSGGLIDIDLDASESVAAAGVILPHTGRIGGRETRPRSHRFYLVDTPPDDASDPFDDPCRTKGADGWRLIEIRSTRGQTIIPPSVHPDGDAYRWDADGTPARLSYPDLHRAVALTATAALMARYWPEPGQQHDASLHWSGWLLRGSVAVADVELLIDTAVRIAHDPKATTRARDAKTTAERLARGENVTGGPSLCELLGDDIASKLMDRIAGWLNLSRGSSSGTGHGGQEEQPWPPRGDVPTSPPIPEMPPELIPEPLRPWICDISDSTCLPLQAAAAPAIVALSSLIGRTVGIKPFRFNDFLVVPNLWGALIARPGMMKSYVIEEATKPLARLSMIAREEFQEEDAANSARRVRIEAQITAVRQQMVTASKGTAKKPGKSLQGLEEELTDLTRELGGATSTLRRYTTTDSTIEKLGELLIENPRGLLVLWDELTGWLTQMERQGHEQDRAFYLAAWNGTGGMEIDRIARGSVYIPAVTISIFGGIQPSRLRPYVEAAVDGDRGDDGLLQRLQLPVWVDTLPEWKAPARYPDSSAKNAAFAVFRWLDAFDPSTIGAVVDGPVPYVTFDGEAQALIDDWHSELELRLRSEELSEAPAFEAHIAKYRSLLPSLALIFYLVDLAAGGTDARVSANAVVLAKTWVAYFELHARKIYAAELSPGVEAAQALVKKIVDGAIPDGSTPRDIYNNGWSGLRTAAAVDAGLQALAAVSWLRIETVDTGGRPSRVVRLHPELRTQTP